MYRPNFESEIEEFTLNLLQPRGLAFVVQQRCGTHTGNLGRTRDIMRINLDML